MRRALFAALLLCASFAARAQPCPAAPPPPGCPTAPSGPGSARLCWAHDGNATDGAPISLSGFKAYYGLNGSQTSSQNVSGGTTRNALLTGLAPGLYTLSVAAMAGTVESARSCTVTKLVAGVAANPPTVPQPVTVAGPVFNLGITTNSMVLLEAGVVASGLPCDPSQQIAFQGKSYMLVPASSVTPFPGQQILAAWATCQ